MSDERPESILIRLRRTLPMWPGRFRACASIKPRDFASIIPCRACNGKLVNTPPPTHTPIKSWYMICLKCGKTWLLECGGNPDVFVMRVSPAYELGFGWIAKHDQDAYEAFKTRVIALGHEPGTFAEFQDGL